MTQRFLFYKVLSLINESFIGPHDILADRRDRNVILCMARCKSSFFLGSTFKTNLKARSRVFAKYNDYIFYLFELKNNCMNLRMKNELEFKMEK